VFIIPTVEIVTASSEDEMFLEDDESARRGERLANGLIFAPKDWFRWRFKDISTPVSWIVYEFAISDRMSNPPEIQVKEKVKYEAQKIRTG